MQSTTKTRPSNGTTIQTTVNEMFVDWKSLSYTTVETDFSIQNLNQIINRLKYLHDGYLPEPQIQNAINELETLQEKLIHDKTDVIGESIEIEAKIINLIESSNNDPDKVRG